MKLRKSLEPALSRELTHGGGCRKDAIVLPVCKARGVHWPVIPVSQSQEPSEAAAALLGLWGKEFPLCSHVAPSVRVGSTPRAWGLLCPVLGGPTVLLAAPPPPHLTFRLISFLTRHL